MKTSKSVKAVMAITIICLFGAIMSFSNFETQYVVENKVLLTENSNKTQIKKFDINKIKLNIAKGMTRAERDHEIMEAKRNEVVYGEMTLGQVADQLDRSLKGILAGHGYDFAYYSTETGVDPYLAVAISLHETGCSWQCSSLATQCYNLGGLKYGSGSKCNGGSYASFPTLEDGIKSYINILYKNYVGKGYNTPEKMGPVYAGSAVWASQVNGYINRLKAA